jgi:2-polyprenyl-6-hydroxyphenyl methylase/3-demethylubiquinone-9 3-methyltransferase
MLSHQVLEDARGHRFEFGKNWKQFIELLDDRRIATAEQSLRQMLEVKDLAGKTFLDIGSGSGLFSLVACRLGARVHSFDYDPQSVACTKELRRRYSFDDSMWTVEQGSVLDISYLNSLGKYDIVLSWGVLHHTGAMWQAFDNVARLVAERGKLFIAIYNDQGKSSQYWLTVKRLYNSLPNPLRFLILWPAFVRLWGPTTFRDFVRGHPFHTWRTYGKNERGMSPWRDVVDWVGGYPFEVAKPEEVVTFFGKKGFFLFKLKTCGVGHGCNEFVFTDLPVS